MASIRKRPNGSTELRYIDANSIRRSIYLGKIAKRDAETIGAKVDHIVTRQIAGSTPDPNVAQWLADLPQRLHQKLVKAGLTTARIKPEPEPEPELLPTIKEWTDKYIAEHPGKDSTILLLTVTARSLCKKFGPDRRIDTFTAGDAEDFRKWLQTKGNERKDYKTGLAPNTVRRRLGRTKQFFNKAVKHKLIVDNPFADEKATVTGNDERMMMVPAEWIDACIRKAPCEDWRIILAFARYAGMRKHECLIQRWDDIDLPNNRMIVRSHKTPPVRVCPIFPELRQHLLRAKEMAPEGAEYVQTRYRHDANIGTTLEKIITRAGLVPWPKLLQNLRATRETELMAKYPAKDVTSWLGNSPQVANKHYAMTMQASFDRAIAEGARIAGVTAAVGGNLEKVPLKVPQTLQDKGRNPETRKKPKRENPVNNWVCLASALGGIATKLPRQDSHNRLKHWEIRKPVVWRSYRRSYQDTSRPITRRPNCYDYGRQWMNERGGNCSRQSSRGQATVDKEASRCPECVFGTNVASEAAKPDDALNRESGRLWKCPTWNIFFLKEIGRANESFAKGRFTRP
ncbi:hypothetical protein Q31b_19630 [Novipirellula aureliae]|uniref:Core-binding (CB) domain-containing protein n=1 Tax=Novipirellula aureliae TaxID=2527966 RepID=A0A5C6E203_9BACT|nr:phage integrase SAM-like domain-containing protein [Novipirellula aureliae]TWU42930.1 hypothetical protein Q31b_19630 [Novipirellula aureliae]